MLTGIWSMKGGSGTTVTTCAIARLHPRALIIDTCGDVPAVLGLADSDTPGARDWLAGDSPRERLDDLVESVDDRLGLLRCGTSEGPFEDRAWRTFAEWATERPEEVIVDLGTGVPSAAFRAMVRDLMVIRPCYLSLRRAARSGLRPDGVIVVCEPGRALTADDVGRCLDVPVVATVRIDPTVARAVDAGLILSRLPATLRVLDGVIPA